MKLANRSVYSLLSLWITPCLGRFRMSLRNAWNRWITRRASRPDLRLDPPEEEFGGPPDLIQPIIGWRIWRTHISPHDPLLFSLFSCPTFSFHWRPGRKFVAQHDIDLGGDCRGLVNSNCSCGIYAFKDFLRAFSYLVGIRHRLQSDSFDVAVGTVSLWGKVIECERGYRAQYAYPRHVYLPITASGQIRDIADTFSIPIGIYASMREEEISLSVPPHWHAQQPQSLRLIRSDLLGKDLGPYELNFYNRAEPEISGVPPCFLDPPSMSLYG